jgi:hypothetical protein
MSLMLQEAAVVEVVDMVADTAEAMEAADIQVAPVSLFNHEAACQRMAPLIQVIPTGVHSIPAVVRIIRTNLSIHDKVHLIRIISLSILHVITTPVITTMDI